MNTGIAYFRSKSNGGIWGNILAGGVIGYAIDASNGAGFDYPPLLTVEMGVTQTPPKKEAPQNNNPMGLAK
jgi:phosphoketolase